MKVLGGFGILGGFALIVAFVPSIVWSGDVFNLRLVLFNIGAISIAIALDRRHAGAWPRLAVGATVPVIAANTWYALLVIGVVAQPGDPGPGVYGPWFAVAATALWLADALLGIVIWRLGPASRPAGAALAVGSILAWGGLDRLGLVSGDLAAIFAPLSQLGILLNGIAWIALGVDVALRRPAGVAADRAAVRS